MPLNYRDSHDRREKGPNTHHNAVDPFNKIGMKTFSIEAWAQNSYMQWKYPTMADGKCKAKKEKVL